MYDKKTAAEFPLRFFCACFSRSDLLLSKARSVLQDRPGFFANIPPVLQGKSCHCAQFIVFEIVQKVDYTNMVLTIQLIFDILSLAKKTLTLNEKSLYLNYERLL